MSLNMLLNTMKSDNCIINRLDQYLIQMSAEDVDRRYDINSPSRAGACARAIYLGRTGLPPAAVPPRTRRVFDNGSYTHERLQKYMEDAGISLMLELPVVDEDYEIMGHVDAAVGVRFNGDKVVEAAVAEIKTINTNGFQALKDAKPEHKVQATCYLHCLNKRRNFLIQMTPLKLKLYLKSKAYKEWIYTLYDHLVDGNRFTREEKLAFRLLRHQKVDELLYSLKGPLTKMVFLYENKDTQELKEYIVTPPKADVKTILDNFKIVNKAVRDFNADKARMERIKKRKLSEGELRTLRLKHAPAMIQGAKKSSGDCRWCEYTSYCHV